MKQIKLALISVMLLSGCAGPSYWHESPDASLHSLEGSWQGMTRSKALWSVQETSFSTAVDVSCDHFADRVSMDIHGDQVAINIGDEPSIKLKGKIHDNGVFMAQREVVGDTLVAGSVPIFSFHPMLVVSGQLDPDTGLGQGKLLMGPENSHVGCDGGVKVAHGAQPALQSQLDESFHVKYLITPHENSHDSSGGGASSGSGPSPSPAPSI